ncbi:hypothetical protein GCM10007857_63610 [Bradyrhizobium iriomotense]|uniref:Uncharacterized protein n=1 Tax=Bradyrhizobium iriomotense TaxID=441950 RepID=A0ABQ6B5G1_9BRAD|nr:hypothetical protein GCM10007857_63610 [Bradyrhizobium iriomotense]
MGELSNGKRQGRTDDRDSERSTNSAAVIQCHYSGADGDKKWEGVYCESNGQPEQQAEPNEIEGKSKGKHGGGPA